MYRFDKKKNIRTSVRSDLRTPNRSIPVEQQKRALPPAADVLILLRGTIVNRTYGIHKNLPSICLTIFTINNTATKYPTAVGWYWIQKLVELKINTCDRYIRLLRWQRKPRGQKDKRSLYQVLVHSLRYKTGTRVPGYTAAVYLNTQRREGRTRKTETKIEYFKIPKTSRCDGLRPACALRTHVPVTFYVRERLLLRESPRRSGYQHTRPLNDDTICEKGPRGAVYKTKRQRVPNKSNLWDRKTNTKK